MSADDSLHEKATAIIKRRLAEVDVMWQEPPTMVRRFQVPVRSTTYTAGALAGSIALELLDQLRGSVVSDSLDEVEKPSHVELGWGCDSGNGPHYITTLSDDAVRHVGWVCTRCDREWLDSSPTAAATPEVVNGEEAQELPPGSAIVDERDIELGCNPPARVRLPGAGHMPSSWTGGVPGLARAYRVVHRAQNPDPPKPLAVGDVVETAEQLDSLPVGAVVRDAGDIVGQRKAGGWFWTDPMQNEIGPFGMALVIDLPETGDAS